MGNYGSGQVGFILANGYNILGSVTKITDDVEAITELNHALGDTWQESYPVGLSKFMLSQEGFYDDLVGNALDELKANTGTTFVFCYTVEGNTNGKHFIGFQAPLETKIARLPSIGALSKLRGTFNANGAVETGMVLHAHATEAGSTGDTKATSVDASTDTVLTNIPITSASKAATCVVTTTVPHGLVTNQVILIAGNTLSGPAINGQQTVTVTGASTFTIPVNTSGSAGAGTGGSFTPLSTVNGGAAYAEVETLTLGGFTNWAPLVIHSVDNVTFTTLATFTPFTVFGGQRVSVAAGTTVKRYLAMSWTYGGAGAAQSVKFMVGFARA